MQGRTMRAKYSLTGYQTKTTSKKKSLMAD